MISAYLVVVLTGNRYGVVHISSKLTSSGNSGKQIEQGFQQFVGRKVLRPYNRDRMQVYVLAAPFPRRIPRRP